MEPGFCGSFKLLARETLGASELSPTELPFSKAERLVKPGFHKNEPKNVLSSIPFNKAKTNKKQDATNCCTLPEKRVQLLRLTFLQVDFSLINTSFTNVKFGYDF
jgi:hypothetical protein